jgi:hypothetical protein
MAAFGAAQSRIFPATLLEIKDADGLRSAIEWHARTDGTLLSRCVRVIRRHHGACEDLVRLRGGSVRAVKGMMPDDFRPEELVAECCQRDATSLSIQMPMT